MLLSMPELGSGWYDYVANKEQKLVAMLVTVFFNYYKIMCTAKKVV